MCRESVLVRGATQLRVGFGSRGRQRSRRAAGVARSASRRGARATRRQVTSRVTRRPDCAADLAARMAPASMSVIARSLSRAISLGGSSSPIVSMASNRSAARRLMSAMRGLRKGLETMPKRLSPRSMPCSRIAEPITSESLIPCSPSASKAGFHVVAISSIRRELQHSPFMSLLAFSSSSRRSHHTS